MRTLSLRREITGRAQGANPTMKKISKGAVQSLPITMPPVSQQQEIVAQLGILSVATQRLEAIYQRKLASLAELKQAILRKAFAGELTAQPEKALPEAAE
jgi:type I restriction enzyme S subunit